MSVSVTYRDKAKQWGEGYILLQHATKQLEEIVGPSAPRVSAEWDRTQDERGRIQYTLKLSDFTGDLSAIFTPDELGDSGHMRFRLLRLWGDLLQARSDAQLRKLQELVKEGD